LRDHVFQLARQRKSVRKYSDENVNMDDLYYAIRTALEAPSGANRQPWRFILVRDEYTKRRIRDTCEYWERRFHGSTTLPKWFADWLRSRGITWRKSFLTEAPVLIAVAADTTAPYWKESTWLSIGYLLLALEERGLASLTYTPTNPRAVAELLGIPRNYSLECIIPVGKAAEDKVKEARRGLEKTVYIDLWGRPALSLEEGKADSS